MVGDSSRRQRTKEGDRPRRQREARWLRCVCCGTSKAPERERGRRRPDGAEGTEKQKKDNTVAKALAAAIKMRAAHSDTVTAGLSLLKMIKDRSEWAWATGLKGALEKAIKDLEDGLDEFRVAFTTLGPEQMKKDYARTLEAGCQKFCLQTDPLVECVSEETRMLTDMHSARYLKNTPQKPKPPAKKKAMSPEK